MYWPLGTPRIYATSVGRPSASRHGVSRDGIAFRRHAAALAPLANRDALGHLPIPMPSTPLTPVTPLTPDVKSVEFDEQEDQESERDDKGPTPSSLGLREPILALRVARSGHIFAVITSTSMVIWQTKPTVILAVVVRSDDSLQSYGTNIDLLLRPDSAIFVVHTSLGYLITYSLATDADSKVYKPHFASHTNIQRRRQSHAGDPGHVAPEQILWGPGEGPGVRDVSVRFRMVIKVDAGIESVLALDDELVVATRKPAAVQCIRWAPDSSGSQTSTELLSRMSWLGKKITVKQMTHDRPMNLSTWITSDGRAYAVQRTPVSRPDGDSGEPSDPKRLFKGYCFHVPQTEFEHATQCVINARFSLIAVGCADGIVRVYSAKDYSGNIPPSHVHSLSTSTGASGDLTTLSYSPDGYCLFAGFEKGWAIWSVYGKALSNSFGADQSIASANGEEWLSGVMDAAWVGGACEVLLVSRAHEAIWLLEMARSAVTGCYSSANLFRTVLQSTSSVMIYRGYDLPDLTSISAEPSLWHTARIPAIYLSNQWPIKCTTISADGRYVAVAGRRGLAHYSINSGRWKTFANEAVENDFQVRGGMCWYQNILVAAVEANKSFELRLYSREAALDSTTVVHTQQMSAPVVLVTPSGEDSLLVYTYDNLLHHFVFAPAAGSIKLIQVGHIAFHGIVRSPARVRGLSWILPESQLLEGDPSQDVAHASVLFLVDGKLVLLRPSVSEGHLKYDMRVIVHNVEYYVSMRDQPFPAYSSSEARSLEASGPAEETLRNSLWIFDGSELKAWADLEPVLKAISGEVARELPPMISVPVDFYPLSALLGKAIVLGVESDLVQRRDVNFSFFRFSIRTHLFLPDILRSYLVANKPVEALRLAQRYENLEYFAHGLEVLLHHVLDEEVDANPPPAPEHAILPRVLSLLSSFRQYLDIVVQCTRKTEVRSWRTLFAYLPPPQELFEESLQRGSLKTAGGYLLILHTFDELATASEQSVRLLTRAMREEDWELCKELARFLAALDETGDTLREAMDMVKIRSKLGRQGDDGGGVYGIAARLEIPPRSINGSPSDSGTLGPTGRRNGSSDSEADGQSLSDGGSVTSGS
ncbi:RIC1-domain-containing protein [Lasiosphaeria miniovina]|uniref:RIC1-domain-containing protein n=1 Tax=Lasiosphaeria miniovina TaxID=1954250 RepID=A0AA40BG87_9PEZI|nr:RIC1-domain-containing protein [Lasiosphaeria miniovina]KAK0733373.1 RIC1-domain-containing protein [Lasiosphaeria miniovina]